MYILATTALFLAVASAHPAAQNPDSHALVERSRPRPACSSPNLFSQIRRGRFVTSASAFCTSFIQPVVTANFASPVFTTTTAVVTPAPTTVDVVSTLVTTVVVESSSSFTTTITTPPAMGGTVTPSAVTPTGSPAPPAGKRAVKRAVNDVDYPEWLPDMISDYQLSVACSCLLVSNPPPTSTVFAPGVGATSVVTVLVSHYLLVAHDFLYHICSNMKSSIDYSSSLNCH